MIHMKHNFKVSNQYQVSKLISKNEHLDTYKLHDGNVVDDSFIIILNKRKTLKKYPISEILSDIWFLIYVDSSKINSINHSTCMKVEIERRGFSPTF